MAKLEVIFRILKWTKSSKTKNKNKHQILVLVENHIGPQEIATV